jgi:hypothetical protein
MRPSFGELLHNFNKVDRTEKVSPREVGDQIDFLLNPEPIRVDDDPRNRLFGQSLWSSFDDWNVYSPGIAQLAVSKETGEQVSKG